MLLNAGLQLISAGCGNPALRFAHRSHLLQVRQVYVYVCVLLSLSIVPSAAAIVMFLYADVPEHLT